MQTYIHIKHIKIIKQIVRNWIILRTKGSDNIVLNFIKQFQTKETIALFKNGMCYYFFTILKARFPQAICMYDETEGHFVAEIDDRFYDITGDVTNLYNPVSWEFYDMSSAKNNIIKNCIFKE